MSNVRVWHVGGGLAAFLALVAGAVPASGGDLVRLVDEKAPIGCEVIVINAGDVEIKADLKDAAETIPVDRIESIAFADEPQGLRTARGMLLKQNPAAALEEIAKIEQAELDAASANVLTDVAFIKAAGAGRVATDTGAGLEAAEKGLREFIQKNPRSHHYFRANEILGDLLVRGGKYEAAAAAYATLEQGPPAFVIQSAMAKAGSFYEQKKYADAEQAFAAAEKNLAAAETAAENERQAADRERAEAEKRKAVPEAKDWKRKADAAVNARRSAGRHKHQAQIGRARCLSRLDKAADAVALVEGIVRAADPEDAALLSRAYAVLGDAYKTAAKDQDAIIAFLKVDLVYNSVPESHAEALFNLVQLWQKVQNPERSREARQTLETTYPDSRWTKALDEGAGRGGRQGLSGTAGERP